MQIMAGKQDIWPRLPKAMKVAIIKEINLSNTINGVSLQWLAPDKVLITMSKPFLANHSGYDSYTEETNPHYKDWIGRTYKFNEYFLLASPY